MSKNLSDNQIVRFSFYSALAATIFVIENLIPKPLPFLKLGLANVVILIIMYNRELKLAFLVSITRVIIGAFFAGTIFSPTFLMSFSGALISTLAMIFVFLAPLNFSLIGVSIIGAVFHNITQIIIIRFVLIQDSGIFYLTPILILLGLTTGIVTGLVANRFIKLREENDKINN